MSKLDQTNQARISRAYRYILYPKGHVWVDGTDAYSSSTVVNAVISIETKHGQARAIAMVNAIERWGNYASENHKVAIFINTNTGSLTGTTDSSLDRDLEERIADGRVPLDGNNAQSEKEAPAKAGEIQTPPDGKPDDTGQGSSAWDAILAFAAKVGNDVYELIKLILTGEYTLVNTLGMAQMRAGDRLCVFLQGVDDQAEIYVDEDLIGARSIGEPGVWDYSDPLKPGKHMIMIVLKNGGRFDYSMAARICRASDYAPGGPKRPIMDVVRSGTDNLGGAKRVYYLKIEVR